MPDPYRVLGVRASATDAEVRKAYRRLAQLHHPDHNHGSVESARKFEEVQEAYAQITKLRASAPGRSAGAARSGGASASSGGAGSGGATDPGLEQRLRRMEEELRQAQAARERARREAREAARAAAASQAAADRAGDRASTDTSAAPKRPTDEELGYITTTDTLSKILADAREELFGKVEEVRHHPATARVADMIDDLAAKLRGDEKP
jgi:curved DNA-binding protein CbpA